MPLGRGHPQRSSARPEGHRRPHAVRRPGTGGRDCVATLRLYAGPPPRRPTAHRADRRTVPAQRSVLCPCGPTTTFMPTPPARNASSPRWSATRPGLRRPGRRGRPEQTLVIYTRSRPHPLLKPSTSWPAGAARPPPADPLPISTQRNRLTRSLRCRTTPYVLPAAPTHSAVLGVCLQLLPAPAGCDGCAWGLPGPCVGPWSPMPRTTPSADASG